MNKIKNHEASRVKNERRRATQRRRRKLNEKESGERRREKREETHHYHRKHIIKIIIKMFMNDVLYKRLKETRDRLLWISTNEMEDCASSILLYETRGTRSALREEKRKWNEIILECPIQYYTQFYLICCFIIIDTSNYNTSTLSATHFFLQ